MASVLLPTSSKPAIVVVGVYSLLMAMISSNQLCDAFQPLKNHRIHNNCINYNNNDNQHQQRSQQIELRESQTNSDVTDRRSFFVNGVTNAVLGGGIVSSLLINPEQSNAAEETEALTEVYFGCGCFWHVQHELVEAEKNILGRTDEQLTSRVGYAGGKLGAKDGKVCYHNAAMVSDYGKLGHSEIVSLRIPPSSYKDFAVEYTKLFKNGLRPDQAGDRGLEYRNIVGLQGGAKNPLANELIEASKANGDALNFAIGKGSDGDKVGLVWIMDTDEYPVYKAEQYHQFHDGFNFGENYPNSYNNLAKTFSASGEDFGKCPRV